MKKSAFYQETAKEKVPTISCPHAAWCFCRLEQFFHFHLMFWIWGTWKDLISPGSWCWMIVGWLAKCWMTQVKELARVRRFRRTPTPWDLVVGYQISRWKIEGWRSRSVATDDFVLLSKNVFLVSRKKLRFSKKRKKDMNFLEPIRCISQPAMFGRVTFEDNSNMVVFSCGTVLAWTCC